MAKASDPAAPTRCESGVDRPLSRITEVQLKLLAGVAFVEPVCLDDLRDLKRLLNAAFPDDDIDVILRDGGVDVRIGDHITRRYLIG